MQRVLLGISIELGISAALVGEEPQKRTPKAEAALASPNDPAAIRACVMEVVIDAMNGRKPPESLDGLVEFLDQLPASTPAGKSAIRSGKDHAMYYRNMILAGRTTLAELEKKMQSNAVDVRTMGIYFMKVQNEVERLAVKQPGEADAVLDRARQVLERVRTSARDEPMKEQVKLAEGRIGDLQRHVTQNRRLTEVLGQDAPPVSADVWLNGSGLSAADLKGKIVVLDFFAVWCGPCIKTFPDLRQWHEQYADKGLVIVGLTHYYNYRWDEKKQQAIAIDKEVEKVPHAEENTMLEQFAKHHTLPYRIAVTGDGLHDFFGGNYIPHVALIDRQGKIRLNRSGDVAESTKEIAGLIEKLVGESETVGP